MKGIAGYSRPGAHGGVIVDTEGMMVDLATVCKAGGLTKGDFVQFAADIFDKVEVTVTVAKNAKN